MIIKPNRLILAFVFGVLSVCCAAQAQTIKLASGREYIVDLPPSRGRGAPLLIVFHGGAQGAGHVRTYSGLSAPANARGYVVIYPSGTSGWAGFPTWNVGVCCGAALKRNVDDVGFAEAIIADAAQRFGINQHRVFLTGISNGAMLDYRIAAERPDLVAGIAPIAGALVTRSTALHGSVPIIDFHGDSDTFVKYEGGVGRFSHALFRSVPETLSLWAKQNGLGLTPKVTKLPDISPDGTRVERYEFGDGKAPLVHYRVIGGGHNWPGRTSTKFFGPVTHDINANELMLDYFASLPDRK